MRKYCLWWRSLRCYNSFWYKLWRWWLSYEHGCLLKCWICWGWLSAERGFLTKADAAPIGMSITEMLSVSGHQLMFWEQRLNIKHMRVAGLMLSLKIAYNANWHSNCTSSLLLSTEKEVAGSLFTLIEKPRSHHWSSLNPSVCVEYFSESWINV